MQRFFSRLFNINDDKPIGLVSLGIKKTKTASIKNSLSYNFEAAGLSKKVYDNKKVLTINDFID